MLRLAVLHSTIRAEEKLIQQAAAKRGVEVLLIDIRNENLDPEHYRAGFDVALQRSVSTVKGAYAAHFLEAIGVPVVNSSAVSRICEDKYLTSLALQRAGVATLRF